MLVNLYTLFLQCTPPLPTQATNGGELPPWPEPTPIPTECTTGIVLQSFEAQASGPDAVVIIAVVGIILCVAGLLMLAGKNQRHESDIIISETPPRSLGVTISAELLQKRDDATKEFFRLCSRAASCIRIKNSIVFGECIVDTVSFYWRSKHKDVYLGYARIDFDTPSSDVYKIDYYRTNHAYSEKVISFISEYIIKNTSNIVIS